MNIKRIGLAGSSGVPVGGSSGTGSSTTVVDNLESISKSAALSANMGRELNETKAPKVGYAPDLKVSYAEELVGRGESTPEVIGVIRPTGVRSIGDCNATITKVRGNSVVWNQRWKVSKALEKHENGVHFIVQSNGSVLVYTDSTGATAATTGMGNSGGNTIKDHKMLIMGCPKGGSIHSYSILYANYASDIGNGAFMTSPSDGVMYWPSIRIESGTIIPESNPLVFERKFYDLTQMFGAGNEPTTIEEFEARKPLGVSNEYNEGTIVSFQGGDVKSVGFNAWDEEVQLGYFDTNSGKRRITSDRLCSKNPIKIIPNSTYYKNVKEFGVFYDINMNYIGSHILVNTFTTPPNAAYYQFNIPKEYGTTYNNDICIHLVHSGYRNGDYEPYVDDIHPLPDIKSIKDSNGDILFPYGLLSAGSVHDEITATKAIKRVGRYVIDGSQNWFTYHGNFRLLNPNLDCKKHRYTLLSSKYTVLKGVPSGGWTTFPDKSILLYNADAKMFVARDSTYSTVEDFQVSLVDSPIIVNYELAEPIEVDLPEPLNMTYEAWDFGTEELVAKGATTPLNADIVYLFNAVDRIRENSTHIDEIKEITDNILGPISIGPNVNIEGNISITKSYGINLGPDFVIQPNRIHIKGTTDIDNIDITSEGIVIGSDGHCITIGKNTNIGNNISIGGQGSVLIGSDVYIDTSYGITIGTGSNPTLHIGTGVKIAKCIEFEIEEAGDVGNSVQYLVIKNIDGKKYTKIELDRTL